MGSLGASKKSLARNEEGLQMRLVQSPEAGENWAFGNGDRREQLSGRKR